MKSQLIIEILAALAPVIVAITGWIAAKLSAYIKAKTNNALLEGVLVRLNDLVWGEVKWAEQTIASALKEAKKDGQITKEEYADIFAQVLARVKSHWGVRGLKEAMAVLGLDENGLTQLIGAKIEAAVLEMKGPSANP